MFCRSLEEKRPTSLIRKFSNPIDLGILYVIKIASRNVSKALKYVHDSVDDTYDIISFPFFALRSFTFKR